MMAELGERSSGCGLRRGLGWGESVLFRRGLGDGSCESVRGGGKSWSLRGLNSRS